VQALLDSLRQKFDYVIVDTASNFDECNLAALDMSDKIILVSDSLVPSVQNSQRCLRIFDKLGYDQEKMVLVVNRCDKRIGAGPGELQQALKKQIAAFIPNDFSPVMSSVDAGLPVAEVSEKSEVVEAIDKLAEYIAADDESRGEESPHPQGLFKRLTDLIAK
jgi:pilus assembly protein CpaE